MDAVGHWLYPALVCLCLGDAVAFAEVGLPKGTDSALRFGSFIQRLYLIVACRPLTTGVTDYGVTMDAILSGKEKVPLQGPRFDVAFEGRAKGRLAGKVRGVDYLLMRADGRADLDVRGTIETDDGHRIALHIEGIASPRANEPIVDLFENLRLTTAAPTSLQSRDPNLASEAARGCRSWSLSPLALIPAFTASRASRRTSHSSSILRFHACSRAWRSALVAALAAASRSL